MGRDVPNSYEGPNPDEFSYGFRILTNSATGAAERRSTPQRETCRAAGVPGARVVEHTRQTGCSTLTHPAAGQVPASRLALGAVKQQMGPRCALGRVAVFVFTPAFVLVVVERAVPDFATGNLGQSLPADRWRENGQQSQCRGKPRPTAGSRERQRQLEAVQDGAHESTEDLKAPDARHTILNRPRALASTNRRSRSAVFRLRCQDSPDMSRRRDVLRVRRGYLHASCSRQDILIYNQRLAGIDPLRDGLPHRA